MEDEFKIEGVSFPDHGQPYKPHAEGGGVVVLQVPEVVWDKVPELHKAGRGKYMDLTFKVHDPETYGAPQ